MQVLRQTYEKMGKPPGVYAEKRIGTRKAGRAVAGSAPPDVETVSLVTPA